MENFNFISCTLLKSFLSPLYQATLEVLKTGDDTTYLLIVHYTYKPDELSSSFQVTTFSSYNAAIESFINIVKSNF